MKMKNKRKVQILKYLVFIMATIYAMISLVKLADGHLHTGMSALIGVLWACLILYMVNRKNMQTVIDNMIAHMFIGLFFEFVILGEIGKVTYVVTYIVCAISAMTVYLLQLNGKVNVSGPFALADWKLIFPALAFWGISMVICIPVELYINNPSDFQFDFWYFFGVLLTGAVLMIGIALIGSVLFLTIKQAEILSTCLFTIMFMGYLQGMFLNKGMGILDGDIKEWSTQAKVINTTIWVVVSCVVVGVRLAIKKAGNLYRIICVYISLIQIVSMCYLMITRDVDSNLNNRVLTYNGSLEIDSGNNVIVLLLDRFDEMLLGEIMWTDPDFVEPLDDFILYQNATSEFSRTSMAIPYLLTGTKWIEGTTEKEYMKYAYQQSDLFQKIKESGYDIALYTDSSYVVEDWCDVALNSEKASARKCIFWDTIMTMMNCSKYRIAPTVMKDRFIYYSNDINDLVADKVAWRIDNDLPFWENLVETGLSIKENGGEKGTYYFYHFFGPHGPTNMSEDMQSVEAGSISDIEQTRADLKMLYEYMSQLKKLGKYDDSTIIITADHGYQSDYTPIPAILVKRPYQHNEELQINTAPVSQTELLATILDTMGIEHEKYGRTLEQVPVDELNTRIFASVWEDTIYKWVIKGDAREPEYWTLEYSTEKE